MKNKAEERKYGNSAERDAGGTAAAERTASPLEADHLVFSYGDHPVLDGVSFSLRKGEFTVLMGPNGTGKSTLFRLLLGLIEPLRGSVRVFGRPLDGLGNAERARSMAYIPQSVEPVFNYTVEEVVLMGLTGQLGVLRMPKEEHRQAVREALESLGIEKLIHRGYGRISGGERQLVLLARALVQRAGILIMDEPTASLDYGNQHRVLQKARSLTDGGYTVLMSTHSPEQAFLYADRAIVLQDGHVTGDGAPEEILTEEMLRRIYGIPVFLTEETLGGRKIRVCLPR